MVTFGNRYQFFQSGHRKQMNNMKGKSFDPSHYNSSLLPVIENVGILRVLLRVVEVVDFCADGVPCWIVSIRSRFVVRLITKSRQLANNSIVRFRAGEGFCVYWLKNQKKKYRQSEKYLCFNVSSLRESGYRNWLWRDDCGCRRLFTKVRSYTDQRRKNADCMWVIKLEGRTLKEKNLPGLCFISVRELKQI